MTQALKEAFLSPSDEFTAIPFWFWNDDLSEASITAQLEDFRDKGVCGFVLHPRIGIPTNIPYLSDRFMHYVKHAAAEAKRLGMKVVLYDEAMYPSGSAHGMVVASNPEYATRALRMEEYPLAVSDLTDGISSKEAISCITLAEDEKLLSIQLVHENPEEKLTEKSILLYSREKGYEGHLPPVPAPSNGDSYSLFYLIECYSKGTIRGIHEGEDDRQPHAPASADLLNPQAMQEFIHLTHDRYYEVLKDYFGSTVIAVFTDEPDVLGRNHRKNVRPWTTGFLDWWEQAGGEETELPLLWLDNAPEYNASPSSSVLYRFNKAVNSRMAETYYGQLSRWCASHGIALAGHPAKSTDIGFLKYFQIPGQDLVWRWVAPENSLALTGPNSTMAKCSSDAARHTSKRRNSNECFGCCGPAGDQWAFTADNMKWYLDWMFVRGVNLLYPHAFFYSLNGKIRSGERPPDVGPNNIWWPDYRLFSDYIKRMCWIMTDSVNVTPIAILCEEDDLPWKTARQLFCSQIEFNYLEKALLPQTKCEDGCLRIAGQAYRLLLAESPDVLSDGVLEDLAPFLEQGGHILLLDEANRGRKLKADHLLRVPDLEDLLPAIDSIASEAGFCARTLKLSPACEDIRVSHVVKEGQDFFVLVNEGENAYQGQVLLPDAGRPGQAAAVNDSANGEKTAQTLTSIELWHPWEGTCESVSCENTNGEAVTEIRLERRESLILVPGGDEAPGSAPSMVRSERIPLDSLSWQLTRADISHTVIAAGYSQDECQKLPFREAESLTDWTLWPGMENFSGTVRYETVLPADMLNTLFAENNGTGTPSARFFLELGEVHEIARLTVNGKSAGVQMWSPYCFDITDCLAKGDNLLQLDISNSLANGMSHSHLPSGLLGPVTLRVDFFG